MYLCKFGQNPSAGSKDIASERSYAYTDADAPKTICPPPSVGGDITIDCLVYDSFGSSLSGDLCQIRTTVSKKQTNYNNQISCNDPLNKQNNCL